MEIVGKVLTCDRCNKQVFLKLLEVVEADGGFTKYNKYESKPTGWKYITGLGDMCHTCAEEHDRLLQEFMGVFK